MANRKHARRYRWSSAKVIFAVQLVCYQLASIYRLHFYDN